MYPCPSSLFSLSLFLLTLTLLAVCVSVQENVGASTISFAMQDVFKEFKKEAGMRRRRRSKEREGSEGSERVKGGRRKGKGERGRNEG